MAELLSQSQIDELLGMAKSQPVELANYDTEMEARRVRKYDFYSPKKISKQRLKLLDGIYESYARTISSHITSMLRTVCTVELVSMEEQRYYEFNNALGENDIISIINMEFAGSREETHFLLQVSNQIIMSMIDRLLGGSGTPDEIGTGSYTEIELAIYETIIKKVSTLAKEAWSNYMDIKFNYFRYETNPRLVQTISFDETVIIIVLSITVKDVVGTMNICLPSDVLTEIFDKFDKDAQMQSAHKKTVDPSTIEDIVHNIKNSDLELIATLGSTHLLMSDLFSLQPGDVINLNKPKNSDVYLHIEGRPWFQGKLGVHKQNKAIKITDSCENIKGINGGGEEI